MSATGLAGLVEELVGLQSQRAALDARELDLLVRIAGAHVQVRQVPVASGAVTIEDEVREEIAAAVHRSPGAVHDHIVLARLLAGPLRATREALADGQLTLAHARAIAEQARRLSTAGSTLHGRPETDTPADAEDRALFAHACRRLQERVLPAATRSTPGQTTAAARRVVADLDRAGQERRRAAARTTVDVRVYAEDDGLGVLFARLPMTDATRLHAVLDARARELDGTTSVGQGRARALVDAVCGAAVSGVDDASRGGQATVGVEIQVVIDLATLLGLDDRPGTLRTAAGDPPVTAQAVRELIADPSVPTHLRRLVTEPFTGRLLDRGRRRYQVTGALRGFLAARDGTCRFPGCPRRAARCDIDHAHPWDDGGQTDRDNLAHLCRRHHQLKTFGGWDITQADDGYTAWRSPQGREYHVDPPPY